jgi:hypothetical protein
MNASSVPKMTFAQEVIPTRRLASHAVYPHRHHRLPPCPLLTPRCPRPDRLQPGLSGPYPLGCRVRRHGPSDLAVRRWTSTRGSSRRRNPAQSLTGLFADPARVGRPQQRCPDSASAPPTPPPQTTAGPRSDFGALPRSLLLGPQGDRPRSGQEWHDALPKLSTQILAE